MKKIFLFLATLISAGSALTSCKEDSRDPMPAVDYAPVIFPVFTPGLSTFNLDSLRVQPPYRKGHVVPVIEFTIDPGDQRDVKLAAVEVYKTFRRYNGTVADNSQRALVGSYSSFPATIRINGDEAIANIKRIVGGAPTPLIKNSITVRAGRPDAFIFTFEYVLEDGSRIILTPLTANGQVSGPQSNAPFAAEANIVRP